MWIELTSACDGKKVLVNMDKVTSVSGSKSGGCYLYDDSDAGKIEFQESYEEVKSLLREE
jgi:hypothetical protein